MNCLEFKRLVLADPSCKDDDFIKHRESCADCLKYAGEVIKMDSDLAFSLNVEMPKDLTAKIKFENEMRNHRSGSFGRYAIAASVIVALLVGGLFLNGSFSVPQSQINEDYQQLLAGVVEHVEEHPMTPVWERASAQDKVNALLASYDDRLQINQLENLQFGRICDMGRYRGLHATLETANGQSTFAYIKGEPMGELHDMTYDGYVTRIKPVKGGNLIIVSRTSKSIQEAETKLNQAMVWNI